MKDSQVNGPVTGSEKRAVKPDAKGPVKLAQGKMGALLSAVAGAIVLAFSVSQQMDLIDTVRSLATSVLVFWFLGWSCAFAINWHLRTAHKRQLVNEREKEAEEKKAGDKQAASPNTTVDQNQASPA
ncbi:MAG TPA: hypothetical protein VM163_06320 [bacterium]|nr:hypothetical protein [bacterium]